MSATMLCLIVVGLLGVAGALALICAYDEVDLDEERR